MKFSTLESLGICDAGNDASQYLTTSAPEGKLRESRGKRSGRGRGEVLIGTTVAPFNHHLSLFVCPGVQIRRLDSGNMSSHASMNPRTSYTNEYS